MNKAYLVATLAALTLTLNACSKKEEAPMPQSVPTQTSAPVSVAPPAMAGVTVGTISLGNAIGASKKVTLAADSFGLLRHQRELEPAPGDRAGIRLRSVRARGRVPETAHGGPIEPLGAESSNRGGLFI